MHLSDLHYCFENYSSQWARDKLLDKIGELQDIKFIFITGDLLYKFRSDFNVISCFIEKIIRRTGVDKENVLIVPGNHDFPRGELRTNNIRGLLNSEESTAETVAKSSSAIQDFLLSDMSMLSEFYDELLGKKEKWSDLHFVTEFVECNIVSLNTCLISGQNNEEGYIRVSGESSI